MEKPVKSKGVKIVQEGYSLKEVLRFIENKYKIDMHDYLHSHSHFNTWADAKGYGDNDPEGKKRNASQIWWAEYQADPQGNALRPAYQNFWHWFISQYDNNYNESFYFEVDEHLEDDLPDFVRTILGFIKDEFGGTIEVYYSE